MQKKSTALVFLFVFCATIASRAQADVSGQVDKFIKAEMERQKIPGVSLAVIKDGKPLIVKGYGFANLEHQVPVKPETIFQSGSVGKQFTATAVMLLVQEGKIKLDEKIGTYLGEVPDAWSNITVRHLLSHTSGMTDYPQDFDFRRDYTEADILKRAKEVPVAFKPGEKWQYSNLGYVTLGILIRKVTGKFYGEFLQERIFKPLGMTTARIINEADIVPNRASGYRLVQGQLKNQNWVSPSINTTADGSLYLTVLDMIKWDQALTAGKLLSKPAYEQMWTPVRLNDGTEQGYGFGWGLRRLNGKHVIEHSGAWQGFKSHIARFPDNRLTVIVFANSSNANPDRLANSIAIIVDPALRPAPVTDPDPKLSGDFRLLLEGVISGNTDKTRFNEQGIKALEGSDSRLIAHLKTLGPLRKFELIKTRESGDRKGRRYAVEFDSMTLVFELAQEKDGKIFFFNLQPQ